MSEINMKLGSRNHVRNRYEKLSFFSVCYSESKIFGKLCWSIGQVFPGAWTAILVSLDNVGIWNLRAQNLDTWYLGQEVYIRVVNPEDTNKTELPRPDNALYCGRLQKFQKYAFSLFLTFFIFLQILIFFKDSFLTSFQWADSSPPNYFICYSFLSGIWVTHVYDDDAPGFSCYIAIRTWRTTYFICSIVSGTRLSLGVHSDC